MAKKKASYTVQDLHSLFGNNVRFFRNKKGWSQEKLAEYINVSKNTIHDIEAGKKFVRSQNLVNLAAIFGIDVYMFFLPPDIDKQNPAVIITRYRDEVKEVLDNIADNYLENIKK